MTDAVNYQKVVSWLSAVLLVVSGWLFNVMLNAVQQTEKRTDQLTERVAKLEERVTECQ